MIPFRSWLVVWNRSIKIRSGHLTAILYLAVWGSGAGVGGRGVGALAGGRYTVNEKKTALENCFRFFLSASLWVPYENNWCSDII